MASCDCPTSLSIPKKQCIVSVQKIYIIFRPIHISSKAAFCLSTNGSQKGSHIVPDVSRNFADEDDIRVMTLILFRISKNVCSKGVSLQTLVQIFKDIKPLVHCLYHYDHPLNLRRNCVCVCVCSQHCRIIYLMSGIELKNKPLNL